MKIRSITYFYQVGWPIDEERLHKAGLFLHTARRAFEDAGIEVQTARIASTPFSSNLGPDMVVLLPHFAKKLDQMLSVHNIDYASLGPAELNVPASYDYIADALGTSEKIFLSAVIADKNRGVDVSAARAVAREILKASLLTAEGFANLRFTALANVDPGNPYFPAAYHDSELASFALAIEGADLVTKAFTNKGSIQEGKEALTSDINENVDKMTQVAKRLKYQFAIKFGGIDFSLAPNPDEAISIGAAFENLGVQSLGDHGSVYLASILTDAIDRAAIPRTGFNGLMFPVLEDSRIAQAVNNRKLTIKDLLLFSTVCGTGLDTVPLPGEVTQDQLTGLLMDVGALSLRLNKPLTARLLPVPGKKAGEMTDFNFDFFVNSAIMALDTAPLTGMLSKDSGVKISSRAEIAQK